MAGAWRKLIWSAAEKLAGGAPFSEIGVGGTQVYGGYLQPDVTRPYLQGAVRWRTAHELLAEVSIIAASTRYFLNLVSRPAWKAKPPSDKADAKAAAEFVDSVFAGCSESWARMIRRQAMFRFHGFGLHEWIAKRRDDGRIGLLSVESRPGQTIQRWDVSDKLQVNGVWQLAPMTGREIYLPRRKLVYYVDDMMTDSPEGMGWFRHLVEPAELLKKYLRLEKIGFQRDLSGIAIGRAPLTAIYAMVGKVKPDGSIFSKADADAMVADIKLFVSAREKQENTGLLLDSQPFTGQTADGKTVSTTLQWGLDILTGTPGSLADLGHAVRRLGFDMALIMGTENLLVGREGEGSRALSEDKSRNLYMNVNATLSDMAQTVQHDIVDALWTLNGLPEDLKPEVATEDASFKDAQQISAALRDMATAGAVLSPDDEAINDVRDLLGVSRAAPVDPALMGMDRPRPVKNPTGKDPAADPANDPSARVDPGDGGGKN